MNIARKPLYQESLRQINIHKALFGWLPCSLQDHLGMLRRYQFTGNKGIGYPIVAMIDGSIYHGGLTDRWKGIVSMYALAKATERDFKIQYDYPFALTDFQVPSTYDWTISTNDISQNIFSSYLLRITGDPTIKRLQNLPKNKQIHVYANRDCIEVINKTYGTNFTWSALFNELFQPSPILQQALKIHVSNTNTEYIAVAFRMQNLLGDYPEYAYEAVNERRQEEIIIACVNFIKQIHEQWKMPILVTSDSNLMTNIAVELPYVWTNHGKAAHVDTTSSAPMEYYLKSFVDFYLLSGAQKIYAATTKEMYVSDFPNYAAKAGNIPFERVFL